MKTAEQQAEADDGQNDLKSTTTKSNSSMTSFAEFLDSEEETGVVVEKLNKEHASIISSLTSLNRSWSESMWKINELNIELMTET